MDLAAVLEKSRNLRRERNFNLAFDYIRNVSMDGQSELKELIWQHNPIFLERHFRGNLHSDSPSWRGRTTDARTLA